jgi:ubiquinone/menaquinone biosynthesis C-methylase UbiE
MSFDVLAPHYRWMEFVLAGEKLQRCRTAFLDRVSDARNILTVGEGNGRFLAECHRRLPNARITMLDSSLAMLTVARKRLAAAGADMTRIEFIHSNIFDWTPSPRSYDLIVTHFFLDCFPPGQIEKVIGLLADSATSSAAWLLADFQIPEKGFRRYRASAIHAAMYLFFNVVTGISARSVVAPDELLQMHGFTLRERQSRDWGLLHTDFWAR